MVCDTICRVFKPPQVAAREAASDSEDDVTFVEEAAKLRCAKNAKKR